MFQFGSIDVRPRSARRSARGERLSRAAVRSVALWGGLALVVGCSFDFDASAVRGACTAQSDCNGNESCVNGYCVLTEAIGNSNPPNSVPGSGPYTYDDAANDAANAQHDAVGDADPLDSHGADADGLGELDADGSGTDTGSTDADGEDGEGGDILEPDGLCPDGPCPGPTCKKAELKCDGHEVWTCSADQSGWVFSQDCGELNCVSGICSPTSSKCTELSGVPDTVSAEGTLCFDAYPDRVFTCKSTASGYPEVHATCERWERCAAGTCVVPSCAKAGDDVCINWLSPASCSSHLQLEFGTDGTPPTTSGGSPPPGVCSATMSSFSFCKYVSSTAVYCTSCAGQTKGCGGHLSFACAGGPDQQTAPVVCGTIMPGDESTCIPSTTSANGGPMCDTGVLFVSTETLDDMSPTPGLMPDLPAKIHLASSAYAAGGNPNGKAEAVLLPNPGVTGWQVGAMDYWREHGTAFIARPPSNGAPGSLWLVPNDGPLAPFQFTWLDEGQIVDVAVARTPTISDSADGPEFEMAFVWEDNEGKRQILRRPLPNGTSVARAVGNDLHPTKVAFGADAALWVAHLPNAGADHIALRYPAFGDHTQHELPHFNGHFDVASDSDQIVYIAATDADNELRCYDASTGEDRLLYSAGHLAYPRLSPAGTYVFFSEYMGNTSGWDIRRLEFDCTGTEPLPKPKTYAKTVGDDWMPIPL